MDHFFRLLRGGKFKVIYDIGYNPEWIYNDTLSLNCETILKETHGVTQSLNFKETRSVDRETICNHIIYLDCRNSHLTELPELPKVLELDCSYNRLRKLPELPKIETLYCSHNQLTELNRVPNIQELYCSYNKLTTLPKLSNLKTLFCSYNELTTLSELPLIERLYCVSNNLFSDEIEDWKRVWKFKKSLIKVYVVPKLFIRWKLTTIRHRLSIEHKEAIICHPKTYYVRELYNENN